MRVHVLAEDDVRPCLWVRFRENLLVVALQRGWLVAAASVTLLGAMILAIFVWQLLVKRMATSNLSTLFLKFGLGGL